MRKYKYVFNADKKYVIDRLMSGVIKSDFAERVKFFEKDSIYGRVAKGKVVLYHGTPYQNLFRPIFSAEIAEGANTTMIGRWTLTVYSKIFIALWCLFLIYISIVPLIVEGNGNLPVLYAAVFGMAILLWMFATAFRALEKKRMQKVIEYIERVQKDIEKVKGVSR